MTLAPWLTKAGAFDVEHVGGIPHFNQTIDLDAPPAAVLHTTEGNWAGSMSVFKQHYAPHFMVGYDETEGRVRIVQLVQVGTIGAALVTHNWLARVQVEVIGFSKETPWVFDDETAAAVASLMAACKDAYGIPLSRPWPDGVYGKATALDPHRNAGQFGRDAGWFGHGDVPSPDSHWDPGNLQWSVLFAKAEAIDGKQPIPGTPVALARPCACAALDQDLIYAVEHADAATKAAIMKALAA